MKRTILSALAATMLAATSLGAAQAAPVVAQPLHHSQVEVVDWKPGKRVFKRQIVRKHGMVNKRVVRNHWVRGHRVPGWQRRHVVNDYRRYHLQRPGRGQHWVRVDNDFLLVGVASGIIAGIIAAN
ncbi:MAG TPA: RcnB family protein [Mesorhizobium sp.]